VREESHLDEMRHAIRGDFERLATRRGDQGLMRVVEAPAVSEEPIEALPDVEESRSWLARFLSP
jgi:hypothetical protein